MCDDSAQGSDHPVGVVLDESRGLLEGGRLRAARAVDRRVRLFDRTVGCGSCHSVYAERDNLLVMSNRASALCVACHVL
jgi:predicted CXXCH cytochrome family protein